MLTGSDFLCSFSSPDGRRWISKNCSMDQHPAVLYHELTMTQTTSSSYEEAETINTTMGALMEPEYYPALYRTLGSILIGVILLIGVVGNALVVVVVSRTPSMHSPTNCYLVSLAVADILLLVSAALPTLVEYHLIVDQFILGSVGCSVMVFTQYLGVNLSSLSITAFTVERYIAICHPIRSQTICTVGRAKKIILFLWVFGVSYCGPWLGLARTVPLNLTDGSTIERCTFTLPRNHYLVYYLADLIIFYAVPLLTACILYGLIGVALYASTLRQSTSGGGVGGTRGVPDKGDVRASTGVSASKGVRQTERTVLVVRNSSAVGAVEAEGRSRDRQKRALGSTPEERNSPKRAKKITSSTRSLATSRVQVTKRQLSVGPTVSAPRGISRNFGVFPRYLSRGI